MFEALVVKPIFNLLVLIYGILPGHNFGLALVLFTVLVRFLMWPVVKKQLHHGAAMRRLQPEIKRIKQEAKGDRQKESQMIMELYKEREISPFGSIGVLLVQVVILLGLYSGLQKVIKNPQAIIDFAYPALQNMSWLKELDANIGQFDATFLGVIDLTKSAIGNGGGIYWPAMLIVVGSAVSQYFQSKQLMPDDKDARSLRQILREAGSGKQSDQTEVNAAVSRSTRYFIPFLIFIFTVSLPSALGLYWLVGGITAYFQQAYILKRDEEELEAMGDKKPAKAKAAAPPDKPGVKSMTGANNSKITILEGEVVQPKNTPKKKSSKANKRRRR